MKVMEAIGKSFSLTAKSIGLLTVVFIFNIAWSFGTMPFTANVQSTNLANAKISPQLIVLSVIFIFINIFIQGGILGTLKDMIASGSKSALGNFARYGAKFYLKFVGIGLVFLFILALAALIIGAMISIAVVMKNIALNIIVISIAAVLAAVVLYYVFLLFLSPYALVLDDVGVFKAMKNSMQFVKKYVWKLTGLSTLLILVALGIAFCMGLVAGLLSFVLKGAASQVLMNIVSSVVNSYVTILISAGLLIYYNAFSGTVQKKETEGISASA